MVKGLNIDAVAIKTMDNPPDLQAVIPNEIVIISTKKRNIYVYFLLISCITALLLKYGVYCGFIKGFVQGGMSYILLII